MKGVVAAFSCYHISFWIGSFKVDSHTVCAKVVPDVTLVPGRNVAIRLVKKFAAGTRFTTPSPLSQEVSSRNKKTRTIAAPTSPVVHLYVYVQFVFAAIRADNVGPATVPKSKHQWNTVKTLPEHSVSLYVIFQQNRGGLPLWWRKKRSTRILGPKTPATLPKNAPKNRETIKLL